MLDFFELGRLKPSPVSGYEINTVIVPMDLYLIPKKIAILENRTAELPRNINLLGRPSRPRF